MSVEDAQVAHGIEAVAPSPSVVTIGNFDGVHRGHQALLRHTVDHAADQGRRSVAVTFDPHPAAVLRPGSEPPALQPLDDRIAALLDRGLDLVVVLPFTHELASWSPERFVERVLVERLQAVQVVVGSNFRFGRQAAGDVVALVELGEQHGFRTEALTLLDVDEEEISSSRIRAHLREGEVAWVARALGRPFTLRGRVVVGDARGRTIGFPTANLEIPAGLALPADGVYAGTARLDDGAEFAAVTNVGQRPTFDGAGRSIESHLLDTDRDLYGQHLTVSFERWIRGERRFAGVDELVAQIEADIEVARSVD